MTTINHESETVSLGYWKVMIVRDEDDHLGRKIYNRSNRKTCLVRKIPRNNPHKQRVK